MRQAIYLLLAVLVLGIVAPVAPACINDRITTQVEEEFKSEYEFKADYQKPENPSPESTPIGPLASIAGLGLLAGAVVIGMVRTTRS